MEILVFFLFFLVAVCITYYNTKNTTTTKSNYTYFAGTISNTKTKIKKTNSSYVDLLNTQEWHDKRLYILNLHNHKCDWCGSTRNLEIHHKKYLMYPNKQFIKPWEYKDKDLMCLCNSCHKKYHQKYKVKTYYTKYYKYH